MIFYVVSDLLFAFALFSLFEAECDNEVIPDVLISIFNYFETCKSGNKVMTLVELY